MRFTTICVGIAISVASRCLGLTDGLPGSGILPSTDPVEAPELPILSVRGSKSTKRPKFTKRPRPPPPKYPIHHPQDCTVTDLVKNGDFDKNTKGWVFTAGFPQQFFWVKDSKKSPAHSGAGQALLFINRDYSSFTLSAAAGLPAVEFGNSINVTAWLRLGSDVDLSTCSFLFADNAGVFFFVNPTTSWASYSFQIPGSGRPKQLWFEGSCSELPAPVSLYIDDISAKACLPKKPNPDCIVLPGADNFLVNPGFDCPDGITVWTSRSYYSGNDSLAQASGQKGNPTHSGSGMASMLFDGSALSDHPSGVSLYQYDINYDPKRQTVKASFWLSADSTRHDVTGCTLNVGTITGYYIYGADISNLTTKWTQYEIKGIQPTGVDTFEIDIFGCSSPTQPIIYIDDIYFGVDPSAPPKTTTTTQQPTDTPTPVPCTGVASMVDPSFEIGDTSSWLVIDGSPNYDTSFLEDESSTYGTPHAGTGVGVLDFPTVSGSVTILQQVFGLCRDEVLTATGWFYIPIGYDPSLCSVGISFYTMGDRVTATAAGVWTKVQVTFLAETQFLNPDWYMQFDVSCTNTQEMIVLLDDVSYSPPAPCSTTPTIPDGGFETGNVSIWSWSGTEGDETFTITNANPHTGKKSGVLTYPSTSNGIDFTVNFPGCVGANYTLHMWYYMPKANKGISCLAVMEAGYTGQYLSTDITVYDQWTELKLDFINGALTGLVTLGIACQNRFQKMVIYIDDVTVTKR